MKQILITNVIIILLFFGCNDDIFSPLPNSKSLVRSDSTIVTLKYGETILINNELEIGFIGVPADSRCPIDAMCVWAGDGEVQLSLKKSGIAKTLSLHTTLNPKIIVYDNYEIRLNQLLPTRKVTDQIKQEQYSIELKIRYLGPQEIKSAYLIDTTSEWLIKNDNLVVNDVSVTNDILNLSVGYSGGCKEHIIDLFAYTGIMKSNPPQMSLVISHKSNDDMCEASITSKMKFDLKSIKDYLGGMSVYDKIILNIAGTDRQPIKQSPLVYNLK